MTTPEPENDDEDAAWVTIATPFGTDWLKDFFSDIERVYRINSLMEFKEWHRTGEHEYRFKAKNLSNGMEVETSLTVTPEEDGVSVVYSNGLKTATRFRINAKPDGSAELVIVDEYDGAPREEREERIAEVDRSLVQWGRDLHQYFRLWKKWSVVPGWKWYMRRVWQSMKPSARRISFMLIMITVAEFVIFLMIFFVFWLEQDAFIG